jgi:ADP-heptose:LPS heptosyltransferase
MAMRTLLVFPADGAPGLRAEAAQLALGLAASGTDVLALGPLGPWRYHLRLAKIPAMAIDLAQTRKVQQAIREHEPQLIHAFGAQAAHLLLPQTVLIGAGGVATLGHADVARLNPADFRTASAVFVSCDHVREQVARRLTGIPVVTTEYLLPPADEVPAASPFLCAELGIFDGAPLVLMADVFANGETEVARALLEATPLIDARMPHVQVVIAGTGPRLAELEQVAEAINEQLGRRAALLPGHRDDIGALLSRATIAVGSGRFAMEAVGAGVALVAAGAAGMVGTYTEESTQVCRFTCCGKHGRLEPVVAATLATEINGLFVYASHRARFAADGQAAALVRAERATHARQIATYYARSAPTGAITRTPQQLSALLPVDTRELLCCLPALAGLRAHFPLVSMTLAVPPAHVRLLESLDLGARVMPMPQRTREWPGFLQAFRLPRPDACLAFTATPGSTLATGCTRAAHRLGYADGVSGLCFTDHLHARTDNPRERAASLIQALGASTVAIRPPVLPEDIVETVRVSLLGGGIDDGRPLMLLCPDADEALAWPRASWQMLINRLAAERPEQIAVLNPGSLSLPAGVVPVMPVSDSLVLATLLARATVVVAADAAALHMADLLGLATVGLYGPTAPESVLPNENRRALCHREFPCHPCGEAGICADRHCLYALTPAEVFAAIADATEPIPEMV